MTPLEKLKKLHDMQSIKKKDISLRDLIAKEGKAGSVVLDVIGFESKFVPKYEQPGKCLGYHTTIFLSDGRTTGCFSNALYELAGFFYKLMPGYTEGLDFYPCHFTGGDVIVIEAETVALADNKSTYNFEVTGQGELSHPVEGIFGATYTGNLLSAVDVMELPETAEAGE